MTNISEKQLELQGDFAGPDEDRARVALTQLIEIYESQLRKKSEYLSNQLADAEDLYSKTSLIFWSKRRRYIVSPVPWLFWAYRVMSGVASDIRRQRKGQLASRVQAIGDSEIASNQISPSDALYFNEFSQSLDECLAKLDPKVRHVFVMRQYENMLLEHIWPALDNQITEGMLFEQIASSLETPLSRVKSDYDKATKQLEVCLRSKGLTELDLNNDRQ